MNRLRKLISGAVLLSGIAFAVAAPTATPAFAANECTVFAPSGPNQFAVYYSSAHPSWQKTLGFRFSVACYRSAPTKLNVTWSAKLVEHDSASNNDVPAKWSEVALPTFTYGGQMVTKTVEFELPNTEAGNEEYSVDLRIRVRNTAGTLIWTSPWASSQTFNTPC